MMCSAPVYRDVVEDYKHPRRKKKEKKLGELPSYLRGSDSPNKSRKEDLSAYLAGQGAAYGAPDWQEQWNSARFLPDLHDDHRSQVLLPFVKSTERKRKAKAADDSRAAMLSQSLDQSAVQSSALSGETGEAADAAPAKRPPSAASQELLEKERAHNLRPHSAKSRNEDALAVKQKHTVEKELARKDSASRPQSREGVPRPQSREGLPPRAQSRGGDAMQEAATRPPSQAAVARPASRGAATPGGKGVAAAGAGAASPTRQDTMTGSKSKAAAGRPSKGMGDKAPAEPKRGGRKKGGAEAGAAGTAKAGGGGEVDNSVVEALQAEVDAYKAAEERLKQRIKDKDAQIHELTHKTFYLNDELNGAKDRQGKMKEEVERARESNARFDDVKQLLQLSENERVKLMEQVEQLQEDNMKWRPIKVKLEERIEALLSEVATHSAEIHRLQQVESDLKVEKDKVAAANVQVQSWQDIAADLQAKLERWEEVHETTELQLRQAKEEVTRITLERQAAEARVGLLEEMLEANGIPVPDPDDEADERLDAAADDEDEELAEPLTTLRTSALLRGQLPDATVPQQDDIFSAVGHDEMVDEPAFGTHEKQA